MLNKRSFSILFSKRLKNVALSSESNCTSGADIVNKKRNKKVD